MTVTIVLALATLGDATQIGMFLFLVAQPKYCHIAQGDCHVFLSLTVSLTNVINVNDPLD
jgi:hypothetical protein